MYEYYSWRDAESEEDEYRKGHGHGYSKKKVTKKTYGRDSQVKTPEDDTGDVFNSGMKVHSNPSVNVPEQVQDVCISIQEEVGRPEWGALFKGEWTRNGFEVKPDYIIPEQKVSRASIEYTEDLKKYRDRGYVVNIHSHPFSGRNAGFSGVDDDHVNSHFKAALLYAGRAEEIVDGIVNVTVKDGVKVQLDVDVEIERDRARLPDVDISNIDRKQQHTGNGTSTRAVNMDGSQQSVTGYVSQDSQNGDIEDDTVIVEGAGWNVTAGDLDRHETDLETWESIEDCEVVKPEYFESGESEE